MIVRLNRYISMCGITSRRKADDLIEKGKVKINGDVVTELGTSIDTDTDTVEVSGEVVEPEQKRYVLLNKPRFYLTALGEGEENKDTIEKLIREIPERVYPTGRLDYDVEGLLILTNDGKLANKILHPSYELTKVYAAIVEGKVEDATLRNMKRGTELEDGYVRPDFVRIIKFEGNDTFISIGFHEGRNHLVKRFFEKFRHPLSKLIRTGVGPIKLGDLPKGKWRDMTSEEVAALKESVGDK